MPLRNAEPKRWTPKGLSDAVDGSTSFPGAMSVLTNLIPDPSTEGVFVPRPAAAQLNNLQSLNGAGLISCGFIQGDILYGLIPSGRTAGCDEPFAYNLATGSMLTVRGITPLNVPVSPSPVGDWTPATMDALGNFITVTHPGFNGGGNGYFGAFDVTIPTSPKWNSGNLAVNPLVAPPVACKQFGSRMYYAVLNAVCASDIQAPLVATNAAGTPQILTLGDKTAVTALAGLPLQNQLGGIIQSLIAFKSSNLMYQITGDYLGVSNPWAQNALNVATGTKAPNTICSTNQGLAFVAPDGVRMITFQGLVTDPIGANGEGITVPFKNAIAPSRMCAAYNQNILRISVTNGLAASPVPQEYWYDFDLKVWTGPHSFPVALILPWRNTFICFNPIIAGA